MSDDLVKCLWKGVADVEQQQDAADRIEELEAKLAKVIPLLGKIKSHKVFYMEELADLIAELKGQANE